MLLVLSGCGGSGSAVKQGAPSSINQEELDALPTEQTKLVYKYLHYLADGNAAEANRLNEEPVPDWQLLPAEEYLTNAGYVKDIQINTTRSDGEKVCYSAHVGDKDELVENCYLLDRVDGQWRLPSHLGLADAKSGGVCPTYAVIPGDLTHTCKLDYGTVQQTTSTGLTSYGPTIKAEVTEPASKEKLNEIFTPLINKAIEKNPLTLRCWQEDKIRSGWEECPAGASATIESTQVYGLNAEFRISDGNFLAVLASTSLSADFGDGQQVPAQFGTKAEPIKYRIVSNAKGEVTRVESVTDGDGMRIYPKSSTDKDETGWWYSN